MAADPVAFAEQLLHDVAPEFRKQEAGIIRNKWRSPRGSLRKFRALARNWEALGDADPLFGVLSDPTKQGGQWDVEEFFASGRAHVKKLMRSLHDAEASFARGACLDFGCGVGRLTIPLSEYFTRTVGVDVARSMIYSARRSLRPGDRCEFVLNRAPNLRRFPSSTFDVVHSCLVLQHIPPEIALRYIAEFFRVARLGGLVVFQVPAETRSEAVISAAHALPESAYAAGVTILDPPASLESSECVTLRVAVANNSAVVWPHDIPAGRHICLANHWLHTDGTTAVPDDGRAPVPRTMAPGERVEIALQVRAPAAAGDYLLEIDLVQERVCWFAEKGSKTARAPVKIVGALESSQAANPLDSPVAPESPPRPSTNSHRRTSIVRRILRWLRRGTPAFEMHVVPRADVERVIVASGGALLRAVDDNAAGAGWLSYTYICRRLPEHAG